MRINGRPFYNFFSAFIAFLLAPKKMIFFKQGIPKPELGNTQVVKPVLAPQDSKKASVELRRLNYVLQQQAQAENQLIKDKLT
jgi:hypothetical protein